ncbi:poly(rC)-binding protein 3 isoform X4 [Neodiprion pinetum]|uniref:Poly(RC)-binding protein 3 isoform X4 n=1 Tax=Neodiprion lecontei TaxID=441921 RepID=A0ABM3G224_NEOLC|nr:poly(rC)-binding protein 3 isoform X4 [Neodiprion fabricii]XP_046480762.1 poly(rC)-binding protein 3 isoform X4 [Neodiprion pinetum]XP_046594319.1 poly(rC)-binding protein 3 isoform X4 [Neodiprion lecontei]
MKHKGDAMTVKSEHTWDRLRSTSPESSPAKITRLTSPRSLSSSTSFPIVKTSLNNIRNLVNAATMDNMDPKPMLNDDPSVTLTIRLIMQGKEVGSIIGKKGEIVNRFREESGAKINISDGSCPERIVTVTGPTNSIFKAFTLICKKFEEWCSQFHDIQGSGAGGGGGVPRPPITLRLIVPASQCGSLIGKGGSKIKEIREVTGASIQVASEMLPNSTERTVTISGTSEAVTQCIYHICCVMLESPPKGATIPYRPKPQVGGPVILAGGQAYTIQGNYAVPAHSDMGKLGSNPLAGLAALGLGGLATPANTGGLNPAALAGSQLRTSNTNRQQPAANNQTHEMTVPNELIGCIIGKGGTKIAEIRQISGAMIRISNCEEREGGATDRTITITGNPDAVALAQYLINMSVELQKANLEAQNTQTPGSGTTPGASGASASPSTTTTTASPLASAIPLAQLLSKPGALNALSSLTALGGLTELLGGAAGAAATALPVQTTGVHRSHKPFTPRLRSPSAPGPTDSGKFKSERTKYNPY